jgi:hypothetical protein
MSASKSPLRYALRNAWTTLGWTLCSVSPGVSVVNGPQVQAVGLELFRQPSLGFGPS